MRCCVSHGRTAVLLTTRMQVRVRRAEVEISVLKEVKDKEVTELKEQVRDLMFFLEAKEKVKDSPLKTEIEEGSIVVAEKETQNSRKVSKGERRKRKS